MLKVDAAGYSTDTKQDDQQHHQEHHEQARWLHVEVQQVEEAELLLMLLFRDHCFSRLLCHAWGRSENITDQALKKSPVSPNSEQQVEVKRFLDLRTF